LTLLLREPNDNLTPAYVYRIMLPEFTRANLSNMQILELIVQTNPIQQCIVNQIPFSIGSDLGNDLVINDPTVDSFHTKIIRQQEQYLLVDLGSINGTRISNSQLKPHQPQILADGNLLQIGSVIIQTKIKGSTKQKPQPTQLPNIAPDGLRLDAVRLYKSTRPIFGTTIINDIYLSILPKEFVVIAGVSGGGKSTLMDALNGQRRVAGKVLVNGINLYRNFSAFKNTIGYVPQDDIVHPELTVREALNYAAQLRMPWMIRSQRQQRIQEVLEELELTPRKNTSIKRLSGGQRKRVSIGVELITKPSLFFLDEATSGLDPGTEQQIMALLRRLADNGHTVLLITHATKNVTITDMVVFLAKGGRLAYFGPPKLALDYFAVKDFDSIYDKVERQHVPLYWQDRFKESAYYVKYIENRQKSIPQNKNRPASVAINPWKQWRVLCHRNLIILLKNKLSLGLMLAGAPILGSLNFALWKSNLFETKEGSAGQAITMLFVTVIMAVMAGSLATMPEIAKETAIYRRERSAGLGVIPYLASKLQLAFILALYQSAVLLGCMVVAVTIPGGFNVLPGMYITLFLASFGSMVLGLLVSAIAPNQSVAPLLTILVLVPQIVFGGGMLPVSEFNTIGKVINQVMITKYPFESLVTLSTLGSNVSSDFCWLKNEEERKSLSKEQEANCNCYGEKIFAECKFPGMGKISRSSTIEADLFKARLLIEGTHKSYGNMFSVNLIKHYIKMGMVIAGLTLSLFVVQFLKG
jgi:ABC-type multidrug transport system ATPase subunit